MSVARRVRECLTAVLLAGALAAADAGAATLTHGPILGAVSDTSIRVWGRADQAATLTVACAPTAGGTEQSRSIAVGAATDFTGAVQITGLIPSTSYDYRVLVDAGQVYAGRFRTLAPPGTAGRVRFAYAADIDYSLVQSGFQPLLDQAPDFLILGGDNVYVDAAPVVPDTKAGYESRYRDTWQDPFFQTALAQVPTFMMWDDHEIENDWSQGMTGRYQNARVAFDEYQASHNPDPTTPGEIYYSFSAGDVDFFVLDLRSHRSPNLMPDGPGKTMLGATQLAALLSWLDTSTATFKVIISSVAFNPWATTGYDSWDGQSSGSFLSERTAIFDHIRNLQIPGVILLSGDQHWAGVFRMTTAAPYILWEFMPTPIGIGTRAGPGPVDPQIVYQNDHRLGFGIFTIDTSVVPATLRFQWIDRNAVTQFTLDLLETDVGLVRHCDDGLDNDGDGLADFPADPGCSGLLDPSEHEPSLPCDDGVDNGDGDGLVDLADPGCSHPERLTALRTGVEGPACQDGQDDDGDGLVDFDGGLSIFGFAVASADPDCIARPWRKNEAGSSCGLGMGLTLILPGLLSLRRRRRPRRG